MRKLFVPSLILLALVFFVVSCNKKSSSPKNKVDDDGLTEEIKNFVPDSLLDILDSLGMPIYGGATPPAVEGTYWSSPFELIASNRPSDFIGAIYADYYVRFSNQNNSDLTVVVDYVNGPENGSGLGAFIVGQNNNFSVFSELTVVVGVDTAYILNLISGTISTSGIADFYLALFMLDNLGNPSGYFINNNEGRVFTDSDGMADEVAGLPKKSTRLEEFLGKTVSTFKK